MHDDQHGTAVVTLAALLGATRSAGLDLRNSIVGQIGLGAAGLGVCSLLRKFGLKRVLGADLSEGAPAFGGIRWGARRFADHHGAGGRCGGDHGG
ncbi:MAG: malic enzyme-like NAD(P)-binding protein [Myxococcota bacterium]